MSSQGLGQYQQKTSQLHVFKWTIVSAVVSLFFLGAHTIRIAGDQTLKNLISFNPQFTKASLSKLLNNRTITNKFETLDLESQSKRLEIEYTIDSELQAFAQQLLQRAQVPYGAFVAIDPNNGQVLAMVSHNASDKSLSDQNLATRATFPAASLFKVITAAGALESKQLSMDSRIPVIGSLHTLYKRNIFKAGGLSPESAPRGARLISFQEALAKSVNSAFGKVGIFSLRGPGIRAIGDKFLFDKEIPFELALDKSELVVPTDDFGLAETASGYNRTTTISPLHAALIAAAISNDGRLFEPSVVHRVRELKSNKEVYNFESKEIAQVLPPATAQELKVMMQRTVIDGTSRKSFRGFWKSKRNKDIFVAGKTGTLNGLNPVGHYDWFMGLAELHGKRIALAALCIHGKYYGIKASYIARRAIESYFQDTDLASYSTKQINAQ